MKRKIITMLLCAILMATFLTACNDKPKTTSTPTPTPTNGVYTNPPQIDARQKEFELLRAGDEVRLYHWWLPEGVEEFSGDDLVSTYRRGVVQMLKDEYDVTVTVIPALADGFATVLKSSYAGSPVADGMHAGGPSGLIPFYYYNSIPASVLVPIDDYAVDFSDDRYFQTDAQEVFGTFDGKLYFFINQYLNQDTQHMLYVNYDLFRQSGYEVPQLLEWVQKGEWTWDKFFEVAVRCSDPDNYIWGVARFNTVDDLLTSNNGYIIQEVEENGIKIDRFAGSTDEYVAAYDFVVRLHKANALAPADQGGDDSSAKRAFASGKLTFMFNYINRVPDLVQMTPDLNYGFTMVPKGPNATDYTSEQNWFDPFCALKGSSNPAGVLKVMKELYGNQYAIDSEEAKAMYDVYITERVKDEQSKIMLELAREKMAFRKTHLYEDVYYNYIVNQTYLNRILEGEITPKAYLDSIAGEINAMMDRLRGTT